MVICFKINRDNLACLRFDRLLMTSFKIAELSPSLRGTKQPFNKIKRTNPKKGCFVPRNDAKIMEKLLSEM